VAQPVDTFQNKVINGKNSLSPSSYDPDAHRRKKLGNAIPHYKLNLSFWGISPSLANNTLLRHMALILITKSKYMDRLANFTNSCLANKARFFPAIFSSKFKETHC
jgi:hypothetical protein